MEGITMARIRTVKPEFWTDEAVVTCSIPARLLFIGMFNFSDDNGNSQRSSIQMKMKIFPADNIDIEPLLRELLVAGLIMEYENNGAKYLNIKNFNKHQVINNPSKSKVPLPQDCSSTTVVLPQCCSMEGKGRELNPLVRQSSNETPSKPIKTKTESGYTDDFETFWAKYPRKTGKGAAFASWKKSKAALKDVMNALEWQVRQDQWTKSDGQFIPMPSTYLNQRRWEDAPDVASAPTRLQVAY